MSSTNIHLSSASNSPQLQGVVTVEELLHTKSKKKLVLTGTALFNSKPKAGLSFLEENKLLYTDPHETRTLSLAKFLKSSARMDKRLLGDFISKPDNLAVLKAFIELFDFKDVITPAEKSTLTTDFFLTEIRSRCNEGIARDIPAPRRKSTDQSDHRDFRRSIYCDEAR